MEVEIRCPTCDNAPGIVKCSTCQGFGAVIATVRPLTSEEIQQSHIKKGPAYEAYCEQMNAHFNSQSEQIEKQAQIEYCYGESDGS